MARTAIPSHPSASQRRCEIIFAGPDVLSTPSAPTLAPSHAKGGEAR